MSFERPEVLAALVALLALLWIERRRMRPIRRSVSSMLLFESVPSRTATSSERRMRWLSYLLLAGAWSALTFAAAGPFLPASAVLRRDVAVVIDRSASMQAIQTGQPSGRRRFDEARALARRWIERLDREDRVLVLAVPPIEGRVAVAEDPASALDRIDRMLPTDLPGRPDLSTLARIPELERAGDADVVACVFTDDASGVPAETDGVRVVRVGMPAANVAIRAMWVEPAGQDSRDPSRASRRLFADLSSFAAESTDVALSVLANGQEVATRTVPLGPFARLQPAFDVPLADRYEVRIKTSDALASDDRFVIVQTVPASVRVHLVGEASEPLARALRIDPRVSLTTGRGSPPADADLIVWNATPANLDLDAEHVVIDPDAASFLGRGDRYRPSDVIALDVPEMEGVRFRGVRVDSARAIDLGEEASILATARDGSASRPLVVRLGRVTVLPFSLDATDWELFPSFPIFWHQQISRVSGDRDDRAFTASFTGEPIAVGTGRLVGPNGEEVAVDAAGVGYPPRVGLYELETARGERRAIAVQLGDDRESACEVQGDGSTELPPSPRPVRLTDREPRSLGRIALALGAVLLLAYFVRFAR